MLKIEKNKFLKIENYNLISLFSLIILNLKIVYRNLTTRTIVLLSPVLVVFSLSIFSPIYFYVGFGQIFVTTLSSGIIWGMVYFSLRRSTLYNNFFMTKMRKEKIYFSIIFSMIFVTFISQLIFWFSAVFFNSLLAHPFFNSIFVSDSDFGYININWLNINWTIILYTWIFSVLFIFLFSFSTRWFFSTERFYFLFLLIYLLILLSFSCLFSPNLEYVENKGIQIQNNSNPFLYYLYMLIPQYHINMLVFSSVYSGVEVYSSLGDFLHNLNNFEPNSIFNWSSDWEWNFTLIYPFVFLFLLFLISILTINIFD